MNAHIFDIDGTLLDSGDVDGQLFIDAVERIIGRFQRRSDWAEYTHVTDRGILRELLQDNGIAYSSRLEGEIRDCFVRLLQRHVDVHGPFPEIPGARAFFNNLRNSDDVAIAYATGGWAASAKLKLSSAGFPTSGVVLCSADDHPARTEIMKLALQKLNGEFRSITYYGDGPWDQQSSKELDWQFVAVGTRIDGVESFADIVPPSAANSK